MSIRQEKVARETQRSLGAIMDQFASRVLEGVLITVINVEVSADLGVAKVYLGFLNANDKQTCLETVNFHNAEIRKAFASGSGGKMKKVPELRFYLDDSLDKIERIENLLKKIK
jgi:ribosome-binding factor A